MGDDREGVHSVTTTRRYTKDDVDALVVRLKEALSSFHYGKISYAPDKVRNLLVGNLNNKMFFCNVAVNDEGEILGAMVAAIAQYPFSFEAYAHDMITYIRPEHRSLKVITSLVKDYIAWAKERRVRQIRWSQSTGFKMDKFKLLAGRLGFTQIGTHFNMEASNERGR